MRNTTISSSIASVVNRVITSVAVAGNGLRNFLRHVLMHEHMGNWQELCQPGLKCGKVDLSRPAMFASPQPGYQAGLLRPFGISTPAVYMAPVTADCSARLPSVRGYGQG